MRKDWTRLNGIHRSRTIRKALQCRIADPLWTLGRQWQFGEFKGDDAASPVKICLDHTSYNVSHMTLYNEDGNNVTQQRTIRNGELLEPVIERDSITYDSPVSIRANAEAGIQFIRTLPIEKQYQAKKILNDHFPFDLKSFDFSGKEKFLKILLSRSFDAQKLYTASEKTRNDIAQKLGIKTVLFSEKFKNWVLYYQTRFSEPVKDDIAWQKKRLEYRFGVCAENKNENVRINLKANEYMGGRLDWHQFDLDVQNSKGLKNRPKHARQDWLIPTPIRYAGMPSDRFWDFEDGKVFFGGISANETDISQILLSEFATVYSNDWYMLPLTVDTGSLTRVNSITVYDSFGDRHSIKSTAEKDHERGIINWKFFEISGDKSVEYNLAPWLYVPRTVLSGQEDKPVERVVFTRDEMANMAWGIEETIEAVSGHRFSRRTSWMKHKDRVLKSAEQDNTQYPSDPNSWTYRLLNYVPPYWIPFTPEIIDHQTTNQLIRGRMGEWDLLGSSKTFLAGGKGKILQPNEPMSIHEEEIPRGAIEVTRSYQAARDTNGKLIIWAGRKKRPASGDRSSGRQTDMIEKKEAAHD